MKSKDQLVQEAMEQLKSAKKKADREAILAKLVELAQESAPRATRKDRSFVPECEDISQLRKELKSAYGAKSKMKNSPGAKERYEEQIRMIQRRITGLYAQARQTEDYIQALLNFNEDPGTVLQELIGEIEAEYKAILVPQHSKAGLKREAAKYSWSTPSTVSERIEGYLGAEGVKLYDSRAERGDQRVRTLNRLVKLAENGKVSAAQV